MLNLLFNNFMTGSLWLTNQLAGSGLGGATNSIVKQWIGPAYIIIVAGFAITFIIHREFRQLIAFVIIAIIVALLIFDGNGLFGSGGNLTKNAKKIAGSVNTIIPFVGKGIPITSIPW